MTDCNRARSTARCSPHNCNAYFTDEALKDYASSLGPLGKPDAFSAARTSLRGGMTARIYQVKYLNKNLTIIIYQMPDGKIEQYLIASSRVVRDEQRQAGREAALCFGRGLWRFTVSWLRTSSRYRGLCLR